MKQFLVSVLMILATLSSVSANLGDSEDKIDHSSGKQIERRQPKEGTVSNLY